jgi:3-hydroxy-3-methylglutaryl CoA synthase
VTDPLQVGIDAIRIDGGTLSIPFAEIARRRKYPDAALKTVQFEQRSVLQPWEDPVTLAANAARPLVSDPETYGLLVVGTETGLDFGKPHSSYIHDALGLSTRCKNFEVKHACYGGTAGLRMACDWVQSPAGAGRKALVITTDVARRHDNDISELTAGNGAVAMSVSREPRFLAIEPLSGVGAAEVYDVARPTAASEWIDAVLSLASYMDLLELSWEDFASASGLGIDDFAMLAYHCPLVSLVERAHALHMEIAAADWTAEATAASFARRVLPGMVYNRLLGNIYSGSLYLSLLGLIETCKPAAGSRVGCFSYGSGACAEFFSGLTVATSLAGVQDSGSRALLDARTAIDFETYLELVGATESQFASRDMKFEPQSLKTPRLALTEIRNFHRRYEWI